MPRVQRLPVLVWRSWLLEAGFLGDGIGSQGAELKGPAGKEAGHCPLEDRLQPEASIANFCHRPDCSRLSWSLWLLFNAAPKQSANEQEVVQ